MLWLICVLYISCFSDSRVAPIQNLTGPQFYVVYAAIKHPVFIMAFIRVKDARWVYVFNSFSQVFPHSTQSPNMKMIDCLTLNLLPNSVYIFLPYGNDGSSFIKPLTITHTLWHTHTRIYNIYLTWVQDHRAACIVSAILRINNQWIRRSGEWMSSNELCVICWEAKAVNDNRRKIMYMKFCITLYMRGTALAQPW